jgi:hypothetical protein
LIVVLITTPLTEASFGPGTAQLQSLSRQLADRSQFLPHPRLAVAIMSRALLIQIKLLRRKTA